MASTYSYADVVNYVGHEFPKLMMDSFGPMLVDQANSIIWNAEDWRISLGTISPFFLVPEQQDYGAPDVVIPSDFYGLRAADLVYNATKPAMRYPPMEIKRYLNVTNWEGRPAEISYEAQVGKFRVNPRPSSAFGASKWQIECVYKKNPTRISATSLQSSKIPFDDKYFNVFIEALRYVSMSHAKDYKGAMEQQQVMNYWIAKMASEEAINLGNQTIAPSQPLAYW